MVELDDKTKAAIDLIRRTGAIEFQVRYSDDELPIMFMALAGYRRDGRMIHEVDAAFSPERAVLRLAERLIDGGLCVHCGRPCGLDPDTLDTMPLNRQICWYQYDPGSKRFIRGCT
jgi:hypothetical protein